MPRSHQRLLVCLLALLATACRTLNGDTDAGPTAGSECAAAGGQCVIGDVICAVPGYLSCPGGISPAGIFCCLSQVADCGQPAVTTYSAGCDAGHPACHGTAPDPIGAPADAGLAAAEPDASFPTGCTATFPVCGSSGPYACTCTSDGWSCTVE